jgi:hypothetical protein
MALDNTEIGFIGGGVGFIVLIGIATVATILYKSQNHSDPIRRNSEILKTNKARSTNSHESLNNTDLNSVILSIDNAFGRNATKRRKKSNKRKRKSNKRK